MHRKKHWKDGKSISLWHCSPDRITRFLPRSKFLSTGICGVFFSPSYRSMAMDWAHWVCSKKTNLHFLERQASSIRKEISKLDTKIYGGGFSKLPGTEAFDEEKENLLKDLRENVFESMTERFYETNKPYKQVFVHRVIVPAWVAEEAAKVLSDEYNKRKAENRVTTTQYFSFWAWGEQVFVPSHLLKYVKVVSVKKVRYYDIDNLVGHKPRGYDDPNNCFRVDPLNIYPEKWREYKKREQRSAALSRKKEKERIRKEESAFMPQQLPPQSLSFEVVS